MTDKTLDPQVAMRELVDFSQKFAAGIPALQAASGVEVGCSDKEAVFRDDKITLYRFKPIAKPAGVTPVLISYALVNRPYMMDLQHDRSLIRQQTDQANRRVSSDGGKAVVVGSNFPLLVEKYAPLRDRFDIENFSKPDAVITTEPVNNELPIR